MFTSIELNVFSSSTRHSLPSRMVLHLSGSIRRLDVNSIRAKLQTVPSSALDAPTTTSHCSARPVRSAPSLPMVAHARWAAIAMAPGPRARPTAAETGLRLQHQVVLARHVQLRHAVLLVMTTAPRTTQLWVSSCLLSLLSFWSAARITPRSLLPSENVPLQNW